MKKKLSIYEKLFCFMTGMLGKIDNVFKGTSSGLKALQSYMKDSYHKSALYWPEPTINPWTSRAMVHRHTITQSLYVKGTMSGIRYGRN